MGFFWLGRGWLRHLSAMKRASGVFQPSRLTFVGETRQKRCIADCEQHTNWMNVEQTIFAREIISPCFSFGSTDSLFQALSKWERVKRKQNKQLQAGTRFSLRTFSLNGSLEQTILLALVVDILNDLTPGPSSYAERRGGKVFSTGETLCESSQNVVFGTWPMCIILVGKRFL